MGDPRIQERDNPLVRRLNAVAQENERLGTALGGGPRPPAGPTFGGSSTVLPPPAVPLTAEEALGDSLPPAEAEELERRWATDPSNPANRLVPNREIAPERLDVGDVVIDPIMRVDRSGQIKNLQIQPGRIIGAPQRPDYVFIINSLPISEEQKHTVKTWVFQGAAQAIMLETAARLDAMQAAFGLAPPVTAKETESAVQGPGDTKEEGSGASSKVAITQPIEVPGIQPTVRTKRYPRRKQAKIQGSTGA